VDEVESKKHKALAERLARIKKTKYHGDKGVDIRTKNQVIEIEVDPNAFGEAKRQLAGSTKTPYLAVPSSLINKAKEVMKGTRFGVMGPTGKIYKRGKRRTG
jgi:hypothetical protein